MKFSVIICTCNRHEKVMELVNQIDGLNNGNIELILVDSSEEPNPNISSIESIKYHRTIHKNQPYQRFLGFNLSTSDWLLYLDDDMEAIHDDLFEKFEGYIKETNGVGFALKHVEAHQSTSLAEVPKSQMFGKLAWLKKLKNTISGFPDLNPGKLGLNGNKGKQPVEGGITEFVSGGSFLVKRKAMYQNFNFQMYDLYEEKSGKGEDSITGYSISKQGALIHIPEVLFRHNDQQNSSYSSNLENFGTRVMFSRLFLTLEKSRLDGSSLFLGKISYHWFALWRIFGLTLNYIKDRSQKRKSMLDGAWKGWKKSTKFKFNSSLSRNPYWENEVQEELKNK